MYSMGVASTGAAHNCGPDTRGVDTGAAHTNLTECIGRAHKVIKGHELEEVLAL